MMVDPQVKKVMEGIASITKHMKELREEQKKHYRKIQYHKSEYAKIGDALDKYKKGIDEILEMPQLSEYTKLGKWKVNKKTLDSYVKAVNVMRVNYDPNSLKNRHSEFTPDPIEQLASFNKRVELHKKLFEQAGVPYHDSDKANNDSWELYRLIEKKIDEVKN